MIYVQYVPVCLLWARCILFVLKACVYFLCIKEETFEDDFEIVTDSTLKCLTGW